MGKSNISKLLTIINLILFFVVVLVSCYVAELNWHPTLKFASIFILVVFLLYYATVQAMIIGIYKGAEVGLKKELWDGRKVELQWELWGKRLFYIEPFFLKVVTHTEDTEVINGVVTHTEDTEAINGNEILHAAIPLLPKPKRGGGPISTPKDEKQRIVRGWYEIQGQKKQEDYCNDEGISVSSLRRWMKKYPP